MQRRHQESSAPSADFLAFLRGQFFNPENAEERSSPRPTTG
jgi:hypothetical protein